MTYLLSLFLSVVCSHVSLEKCSNDERIWIKGRRSWTSAENHEIISPPRWNELTLEEQVAFSRNETIPLDLSMFVDDSFRGMGSHYQYSNKDINKMISSALQSSIDFMSDAIKNYLNVGDKILIIGSTTPRREALCIALGANSTLTIDYGRWTFDHPQMYTSTSLPPLQEHFDLIIADSSLDHDGLGRYGDPISPDGDLMTADYLSSRLQSQQRGLLLLTVPIGPDLLAYNLMRIYGPIRLPLLLQAEIVSSIGYDQARLHIPVSNFRRTYEPAFILRPSFPSSSS